MSVKIHPSVLAVLALSAVVPLASAQVERAQPEHVLQQPFTTVGAGVALAIEGDRAAVTSGGGLFVFADPFVSFYERAADGSWDVVTNLAAPTAGRYFGGSIALDGDFGLVGDPGRAGQAGRVFGTRFSAGTWAVVGGYMQGPPTTGDDRFGASVDRDGDLALVGAPGTNGSSGAAYIFERDPLTGLWNQIANLVPSSVGVDDLIGTSVVWSNDRALVGAARSDLVARDAGAVFVFEETSPGTWTQVQALTGSNTAGERFGNRFAADGNRLAINAPGTLETPSFMPGTTFVYERDGQTGQWGQSDAMRVPLVSDVGFGVSLWDVALEGENLVVAHPATHGTVHVFERSTAGSWRPSVRLETETLASGSLSLFDAYRFGSALALDGGRLLVGASEEEPDGILGASGAAHEFVLGTLYQGKSHASLPGPDSQPHHLRATDARAGDFYYFVGTASGTSPGTLDALSGITVPINVDAYTLFLLNSGGAGLSSPIGVLDANGEAQSAYLMPGGLPPSFAGLELHYCYLIIDSTTFLFDQVSNPVRVRLE